MMFLSFFGRVLWWWVQVFAFWMAVYLSLGLVKWLVFGGSLFLDGGDYGERCSGPVCW